MINESLVKQCLVEAGFVAAPERYDHLFMVSRPQDTFNGVRDIVVFNLKHDEAYGHGYLRAEFVSRGENTLALCSVTITSDDEIQTKVAEFVASINSDIQQAYCVRMRDRSNSLGG